MTTPPRRRPAWGPRVLSVAAILLVGTLEGLARAQAPGTPARPETWGTTTESYYRMAAGEFTPMGSDVTYSDIRRTGTAWRRFSTVPNGEFIATPHLPSGATITYFELDSCDFNDTRQILADLIQCDYLGNCTNAAPQLHSDDNVVPGGCSYAFENTSAQGIVVNNYGGQILVRVFTTAGDSTTSFAGLVIGYKLQVAPAPAFATFADVPASHPYFQFIEALSRWGVTAGCSASPPLYCPDQPITRGQMAVYLAKALGLYLPQY